MTYCTFRSRISGGLNKQEGWNIPEDELSGGKGQKFGLTVQPPERIEKAPINSTAFNYFSESCHIAISHSLFGLLNKLPTIISERILITAGGVGKCFEKRSAGGPLFGT